MFIGRVEVRAVSCCISSSWHLGAAEHQNLIPCYRLPSAAILWRYNHAIVSIVLFCLHGERWRLYFVARRGGFQRIPTARREPSCEHSRVQLRSCNIYIHPVAFIFVVAMNILDCESQVCRN